MSGPLHGFRVIDLTTMISGPLATMTLADQGAEVIKIEHPGGGDHSRQVTGRRGGFSASFLNNNRGKTSVTLNLKDPRGVEAALRLCETSDVFVQNFRPGVIELRPCSRTLGYFTPVRERGTKWDNSDGSTQTIIRRRQLSDCTSLGRRKAALPRSSGLLVHS